MSEGTAKPKGTMIVFVLLVLQNMFALIPYLAPAAILGDLIVELSIPLTAAAFVVTIYTIVAGLIMFVGSVFIDKLGYTGSFYLAVFAQAASCALCAISPNFGVFMVARAIGAFGFGLNCTVVGSLGAIWFQSQGKLYPTFNAVNSVTSCVGSALAYMLIIPQSAAIGSWRKAYWLFAIAILIYGILCVLCVKYPPGVKEGLAMQKAAIKSGQMPKPEFPLAKAIKSRNFILLVVVGIFSTCVSSIVLTYFPTYLTAEAGLSATAATGISGTGTLAGIIGSLLGGALVASTGRRKFIQILSQVVYVGGTIITLVTGNYGIILVMFIVANVGYYMRTPSVSQYLVEEFTPFDPSIIAPGAALTIGLPMLLNIIMSVIAGVLTVSRGYGSTLMIFALTGIIGLIAAFALTEVGPHAKKKPEAEEQ